MATPMDSTFLKSVDEPLILEDSMFFFDIESTGLYIDDNIAQIAFVSKEDENDCFNLFIVPNGPFHPDATKTNKLTTDGENLYKDGIPISEAVKNYTEGIGKIYEFLKHRKKSGRLILAAHNSKSFDSKLLINALRMDANYSIEELDALNIWFMDTTEIMYRATLFRPEICECDENGRFKLDNFAVKYRGKQLEHDALSDAKMLRSLILEDPFEAEKHLTECLYQLPFYYPYAVPECYRKPNQKFYRYKQMSHHQKEVLHCKWCGIEGHNQTNCRKKEVWEEADENASILKTLQRELRELKQVPSYNRNKILDDIAKAIKTGNTFKSKIHTLNIKEIFRQRDQLNEDLENILVQVDKCKQQKAVEQDIIIISDDEDEALLKKSKVKCNK